jgi:predicted TIM-barrel fold metal-dependent hydrolase
VQHDHHYSHLGSLTQNTSPDSWHDFGVTQLTPGTQEWLDQVVEDIVEPELPILDPHHHMWPQGQGLPYTRNDLHRDAGAGHNVVKTIFMECGSAYNREAPEHLRSLGETKYIADEALSDPNPLIAGIVSSIDLRRDDRDELLDMHVEASRGLFRGIRDALALATHPEAMMIPGHGIKDLYLDAAFRRGVARLGERGFTYDSWHYHHQNREFLELARATPGTTMVSDHMQLSATKSLSSGRKILPKLRSVPMWSPKSADWQCPITALGGTLLLAHRPQMNSLPNKRAITYTRLNASVHHDACSNRTFPLTVCHCRTKFCGTHTRR